MGLGCSFLTSCRGRFTLLAACLIATVPQPSAHAQGNVPMPPANPAQPFADEPSGLSQAAEKLKALRDPDARKKREEELNRPPFEFIRTQVAPFDVLTYVKENHWTAIGVETRVNLGDYAGYFESAPIPLLGMPHAMVYRREDRLVREQSRILGLHVFLPRIVKELPLFLTRPDAIRPDSGTSVFLRKLEPHQMLVVVLGPNAADYSSWGRLLALVPTSSDPDPTSVDRQRYYRLVHAQEPEKHIPPLPTHPLAWTSISHVIWDGQDPDGLNLAQRQALIDWLHWGGQLVLIGGPGPSLAPLRESFLGPYLPAELSGDDATLTTEDLAALSAAHLAPYQPIEGEIMESRPLLGGAADSLRYLPYRPEDGLRTPPGKSVFLTGLDPNPGSLVFPVGDSARHVLAVEQRVGRGRVAMLAVRPTEKTWADWPGLDTFVRRMVLRRGIEPRAGGRFAVLSGPELTWSRYTARDLGAPNVSTGSSDQVASQGELVLPTEPVAAWLDNARLPAMSRAALQDASGITIPGSDFVLRIALAYILALVPANWLLCRFVLRKREIAWALTPLLALGFALVVERGAAYDMGYDTACDEIDVIELQPGYARAHLSRFAALYSTGRHSFTVTFPANTWPFCLPMDMRNAVAGSDMARSTWQSFPEPALGDFPVQPRSLAMFRAEQMIELDGPIRFFKQDGTYQLTNQTGFALRDVAIVNHHARQLYSIGALAPDQTVVLNAPEPFPRPDADAPPSHSEPASHWLDARPFLKELESYHWGRPEDRAEWRLVGWMGDPQPGQSLRPGVDRHRGLRLLVAHLDYGPSPAFDLGPADQSLAPYLQEPGP